MSNTTADKLALAAANKTAIKAAIVAKNPATAPTDVMSQWPTAIASIPSGGGDYGDRFTADGDWIPPNDWPDLPSICEQYNDQYTTISALLVNEDLFGQNIYLRDLTVGSSGGYVLSDCPNVIFPADNRTITLDRSKAIVSSGNYGNIFFWIIALSNIDQDYTHLKWNNNNLDSTTAWCYAHKGKIENFTMSKVFKISGNYTFTGGTNLNNLMSCKCTPLTYSVSNFNIKQVRNPIILPEEYGNYFSHVTNFTWDSFYESRFVKFPNSLDLRSLDSVPFFGQLSNLRYIPNNIKSNVSISFANQSNIMCRDSVALFSGENIVGGFVFNLNTCPNSDQTITFSSRVKSLFSATEQTAIESALNAKNWTVAW